MPRKPNLQVISPGPAHGPPTPPVKLGAIGMSLGTDITAAYEFSDRGIVRDARAGVRVGRSGRAVPCPDRRGRRVHPFKDGDPRPSAAEARNRREKLRGQDAKPVGPGSRARCAPVLVGRRAVSGSPDGTSPVPTKRRKLSPERLSFSAAALEAWRIGDKQTLHREIAWKPWLISPFDAAEKFVGKHNPGPASEPATSKGAPGGADRSGRSAWSCWPAWRAVGAGSMNVKLEVRGLEQLKAELARLAAAVPEQRTGDGAVAR